MQTGRRWKHSGLAAGLFAILLTFTGCAAPTAAPVVSAQDTQAPAAAVTEAATQTAAQGEYQLITAEEAKAMLDQQKDVILVDVRELSEYQTGHIPNAKLLPLGSITTLAATELPDLNAKILVYCRSGRRSKMAAEQLIGMGYTHVYDMGGINSWPYDVVTD